MDLKDDLNVLFHWSTLVKILTWVTLFILVSMIVFFILVDKNNEYEHLINAIWIVIFSLSIILAILFMPYSLSLNKQIVKINRIFGYTSIKVSDIQSVSCLEAEDLNGSIRFGNDGFFGYVGYFRNAKIGKYIMYATEKNNLMMIKTAKKTFVVSCSERDKFIEQVEKYTK